MPSHLPCALRIVDDPRFPGHAFFAPGKVYPCRIRHASASLLDDAINDVRAIAIKFSDQRMQSPFDIEMNTGAVSPFWSAVSFLTAPMGGTIRSAFTALGGALAVGRQQQAEARGGQVPELGPRRLSGQTPQKQTSQKQRFTRMRVNPN
jgi:hypothetical protein